MWLLISLLAAVFFASMWIFARASRGMPSSIVTTIEYAPGPIILAATIPFVDFPWGDPMFLTFLAMQYIAIPPLAWGLNHASQRIEVSLIKPLSSLSSISALTVGSLVFGQVFSPTALWGIVASTVGLLILYHARWKAWRTPYPWVVLAAVLTFGVNATLMGRVMMVWPHPIAMTGLAMTSTCIFALGQAIRSHKHMNWTRRRALVLGSLAFVNIAQEIFTQYAFMLTHAALVVSVKRSSIIMASIAGYYFFRERDTPLPRLIVSTVLVTAGVALMVW